MGNAAKTDAVGQPRETVGSMMGLSPLQKLQSGASTPGQSAPRMVLEEVTPARAKELLNLGGANRNLSRLWVESIAQDITSGHWLIDGNAIRVSRENRLLDGQHRLHAVIKANRPIWSFVAYGIDPLAMHNIDRGRGRTIGDLFKINRNLSSANRTAGICAQLAGLELGSRYVGGRVRLSYAEAEAIYVRYRTDIEWCIRALGNTIEPGIPNGGAAVQAAFAFFHHMAPHRTKVEKMAERFKTSHGLRPHGDPAEALRKCCVQQQNEDGLPRGRAAMFAKTLRAIEAEIRGDKLIQLKVDSEVVKRVLAMRQGKEG